jgi:hypothetical protein
MAAPLGPRTGLIPPSEEPLRHPDGTPTSLTLPPSAPDRAHAGRRPPRSAVTPTRRRRAPTVEAVEVAVEQVVQTASRLLEGRLAPREAVTILATLTREAVPAARQLRHDDPGRAGTYRELLEVIGRELGRRPDDRADAAQVQAVSDDIARVRRALG